MEEAVKATGLVCSLRGKIRKFEKGHKRCKKREKVCSKITSLQFAECQKRVKKIA